MSLKLNPKGFHIILASQSPRRRQLLTDLGYIFSQISKDLDESFSDELPIKDVAEFLACKKANGFKEDLKPNDLLITSDTTVCLENEILNKASNTSEAKTMLQKLSGNNHEVITGVCLSSLEKRISFSVSTKVFFKELSDSEINYYIQKFQPFDKAGAYGIQEWIGYVGVEKIEGSYFNVMGLPVKQLHEAIEKF
jgi:septum formation protein